MSAQICMWVPESATELQSPFYKVMPIPKFQVSFSSNLWKWKWSLKCIYIHTYKYIYMHIHVYIYICLYVYIYMLDIPLTSARCSRCRGRRLARRWVLSPHDQPPRTMVAAIYGWMFISPKIRHHGFCHMGTCVYIYTYIYIHRYIYTYMTYIYVCVCVCVHVYNRYVYVYVYVYIYIINIYMYIICVYIYSYVMKYICILHIQYLKNLWLFRTFRSAS